MSMFYHSTRGGVDPVTSKQAILAGIAPDGGLYVSDQLGESALGVEWLEGAGYHDIASRVLGTLLPDFGADELDSCVRGAYARNFDAPLVTPVTPLGDDWLLELWHGPTCAFKDLALQMLPRLMSRSRREDGRRAMIVTATSGDTGKAALAGFAGVEGTGVTVFYPEGKVSDAQRLQMVTQTGRNVAVCGIRGTFDDAQTQVKRIFADQDLRERLARKDVVLSSANSINVGRLAPQVAYYFSTYAQLLAKGAIRQGDELDFVVPTGNFGDVLAGYYAKRLGLPVGRLTVASNSNKVLFDFLQTGIYDRRRDFSKTISPSMDILVSSNLERMLYYLTEGDSARVASLMSRLRDEGRYEVAPDELERLRSTFDCGWATDDQTREAIRNAWETDGVLIDPHTAVARHVMTQGERGGNVRVCLSTANPYKFSAEVLAALGHDVDGLGAFDCMDRLQELTGTVAPTQLTALRDAPVLHEDVCDRDQMSIFVEDACRRIFA